MKTKITGIIAVILAILLVNNVYAYQAYEGTFYEGEKIEGIYFYKHRDDTNTENYYYHNFHSQATIYRKSTDNNFVYCIESWEPISGAKAKDHLIVNQKYPSEWEYLDAERVEALAYYGYGYNEDGYNHTDPKWYAITQYLIWETVSPGIDHYFTSSITSSTPIYPYEKEIKELNDLVFRHTSKPLFENYVEKKNLTLNQPTIVKDLRDTLWNYEIIDTGDLEVERISRNELRITAVKEGKNNILLYQYYNRFTKPYIYYSSDDYQDMLEPGNMSTRKETIGFSTISINEEIREDLKENPKEDENTTRPSLDEENSNNNNDKEPDNTTEDETTEKEPSNDEKYEEPDEGNEEKNTSESLKKDESNNDKIPVIKLPNPTEDETYGKELGNSEDSKEKDEEKDKVPTEDKDIGDNNSSNEETKGNDSNNIEEDKKEESNNNEISSSKKEETTDDSLNKNENSETNKIDSLEKDKEETGITTLEKENNSDATIKNLEETYEPTEVSVGATDASILSIFFYLLSAFGLLFIHNAK